MDAGSIADGLLRARDAQAADPLVQMRQDPFLLIEVLLVKRQPLCNNTGALRILNRLARLGR